MSVLRLVPQEPVFCLPWHAAMFADKPCQGRVCDRCGRAVAAPIDIGFRPPVCIYCGFDTGELPLIEVEPAYCAESAKP